MTDQTTASPLHQLAVETDTALAPLWGAEQRNRMYAYELEQRMGDKRYRLSERNLLDYESQLAEYRIKADQARVEARPLEDVYRQHGWSRFFLCTASNGHIHATTACPTTFVTTQFAWLPELSGLTEAEAVEAHGEILCSVCFPSAPVAWTSGVSKVVQAERDARAAVKAERAAKKSAKALFPEDPDKGVKVHHDTLRTIAAAKSYLTSAMEWQQLYIAEGREGNHPSYPQADVDMVAEVLGERTHEMPHILLAQAAKRAQKRRA